MVSNPALDYGTDIGCIADADELWSEVSGLQLIVQDAIHRITVDDVLGPGGDGWGFDVRKLVGSKTATLAQYGPILSEVLTRDDRVETADVKLTATTDSTGQSSLDIELHLMTAAGPFDFTGPVSALVENYWEGQS